MTAAALCAAYGWGEDAVEIVPVVTSGDRIQDRSLAEIGGKALWTKELDIALAAGEIHASVHSMKDVETIRPTEIVIAAMLPRADVRDRLIGAASLEALPRDARVGTSSPRRAAQLRRERPDLKIMLLRGNVATRLGRLANGDFEATLLAAAGLDRLGHDDIGTPVPITTMLPAPSQAAVGIETLTANAEVRALLAAIDHQPTSPSPSSQTSSATHSRPSSASNSARRRNLSPSRTASAAIGERQLASSAASSARSTRTHSLVGW